MEFLDGMEIETAKLLLENTTPLKVMRSDMPDRYSRLESMVRRQKFRDGDLYEGTAHLALDACNSWLLSSW